ncbi:MAG: hypothetical protein IJ333_06685 [Clostridia bacterium]|nr:hypothetical protein [Clostridia bacterium]
MKRVLSAVLVVLMLVSLVAITGCGTKAETLKFGMGVATVYGKSTSADGDTNGSTEVETTGAAVLVDADGKIVKCVIDTAQNKATYTSEGKVIANTEFKTKGEKGANYGMAAYGTDLNGDGTVKEWNEQVAAFIAAIEGKTMDEVKALVVNGYGNADIQTAGCTIAIADFVTAVEKAVANAVESDATAENTLKLGVVTSEEAEDATEEKAGSSELATTFTAAVLDQDGKVVVASTDVLAATIAFDDKGVCTTDVKAALSTKKEKGDQYGMAAYGADLNGDGVVKEWNEQGAAIDAALVGKTGTEIAALESEGYGVESVQTAGCTITISDMVKAAVKAATVA